MYYDWKDVLFDEWMYNEQSVSRRFIRKFHPQLEELL